MLGILFALITVLTWASWLDPAQNALLRNQQCWNSCVDPIGTRKSIHPDWNAEGQFPPHHLDLASSPEHRSLIIGQVIEPISAPRSAEEITSQSSLLPASGSPAVESDRSMVTPPSAFTLHLPSEKPAYPGAQYWAEIECPDGGRKWAFAVFAGQDEWRVPIQADVSGPHHLLRVEKRQEGQKSNIVLSGNSPRELVLERTGSRPDLSTKTLVEAGALKTVFAAEEPWCVNDHTMIQGPDKTWHLFGITHPKPLDFFKDPGRRIAHATSPSLLQFPWQAHPPAITADWERYREYLLWAPHVVRHQGLYYMFVCAGDKSTHRYRLHLLTSPDLKDWKRSAENPLLIDGFDGRDPMVMPLDDGWALYYTATTTPDGGNHIVACVTSKDLIHWGNRKVVFVHPQVGTFAGPTESPFVVRRGGNFYLFVCDNDWTDVYLSHNPYAWDFAQKAGRIQTHAAEIVRDSKGNWYITHAGWMSGPISLAPLQWHDALDNASTSLAPATE